MQPPRPPADLSPQPRAAVEAAKVVSAAPVAPPVLAVDLGGTKMLGAVVHHDGQATSWQRRPTPAQAGGAAVLSALLGLLADLRSTCPEARTAAVSAAGLIDPMRAKVVAATDALPGWAGTDLRSAAADRLGLPLHALNDVHAALLGERWQGACRDGSPSVAMVALGTGLGGAWMVRGELHLGAHAQAGHWGQRLVREDCGREGSVRVPLESRLSGTGLARLARRQGCPARDGHEAIAAAERGEPAALAALDEWVEELATLLHDLHCSLDPEMVLIGGGMIGAQQVWWPRLHAALKGLPLVVQPAALGECAGVYGAARWAMMHTRDAATAQGLPRAVSTSLHHTPR